MGLKINAVKIRRLFPWLLCLTLLIGCAGVLQRGMIGNNYISTARPSISITAKGMPLMLSGQGMCNLFWTGMMGGLDIDVWLAVYGEGGLAPMAIVAQAQVPQGWYWDADLRPPFTVQDSLEAFNGVTYQACTYVVNPARDPFGNLVTGVQPDGKPQLWLVRSFSSRFNFDNDKIILQYREPLPPDITDINAIPWGQSDLLPGFAERAHNIFEVAAGPTNPTGVKTGYASGIQWKYMTQQFLGQASKYDYYTF